MDQVLKIKIHKSLSKLNLIIYLSVQGLCIFGFAPQGCTFNKGEAYCDFQRWTPPLLDETFGPEPVHNMEVYNVNAAVPGKAFSGLNGSVTNISTSMRFSCLAGCNPGLSRDVFTLNLYWVMELHILNCDLENGLPTGLLENLKNLNLLRIINGKIVGYVANDTFSGLTELREIVVQASFMNVTLPPALFDGLKNLTDIYLRYTNLEVIPPNWFNGLVNLEKIELHNNNLRSLPRGLFDELRSLISVNLLNNPLDCSCGLAWLLDWTHITDGAFCQSPASVENQKVENAFGSLDCATSRVPILSQSSSPDFEMTTVAISSVTTLRETAIPVLRTSVSSALNQKKTKSTFYARLRTSSCAPTKITAMTLTSDHMSQTPISTSVTTKYSAVKITWTNVLMRTSSWTVSKEVEIEANKFSTSLSSNPISKLTFSQAVSFSAPNGSTSLNSINKNEPDFTNVRNVVLISTVGALTVLLIVAAVLYRFGFRNKCTGP